MPEVITTEIDPFYQEIELLIAQKPSKETLKMDFSKSGKIHQIQKDASGQYHIPQIPFTKMKRGELFDGDKKILSWDFSKDGNLVIDIDCEEHVNLWDNIQVKNLFIKSRGPLVIGGEMTCSHSMIAKAKSLATIQAIHCQESFVSEAAEGVRLFSSLSAKASVIRASAIYQTESIDISEQADFTCKLFSAENKSVLTSPVLRLIAENARLSGQVHVPGKFFVTAKNLTFGQEGATTQIALAGDNYIQADTLSTSGNTDVSISTDEQKKSILDIKMLASIGSNVHFTMNNTTADMHDLDVSGNLSATGSELSCQNVVNKGDCQIQASKLAINSAYVADENGKLKLADTHALIHESRCVDGELTYDNSVILGQKQFIKKGTLSVGGQSSICLTHDFYTGAEASVSLSDASITSAKKILMRGPLDMTNTGLDAPEVHCDSKHLHGRGYRINATKEVTLSGAPELVNGTIDAPKLLVKGEAKIQNARIYSQDLSVRVRKALMEKLRIRATQLDIEGGEQAEDVQFNNCSISTENILTKKKIKISSSNVNIIGTGDRVQSLGENVVLDKTRLISSKKILQASGAELNIQGYSHVSVPAVYSEGTIHSHFSTLFAQRLHQIGGALISQSSHFYLSESLGIIDGDVQVEENSKFIVPQIRFHGSQTFLRDSTLIAADSINVDSKSNLEGTKSIGLTKDFVALGNISIDESILGAEQLSIYKAFDVANQSQVEAEALINIARKAVLRVKKSQVKSKSIDLNGTMRISAGSVKADETFSVRSNATLVLNPESVVMAKDLDISGKVRLPLGPQQEAKTAAPAQIRVDNRLLVHSGATIRGAGSLVSETHEFLNFGDIRIGGSLVSRGDLLFNAGKIKADTVFLGFDDAVVNCGTMSSREMTINSNFINLLGGVSVKQSMTCSGLYGVNLGGIAANNYSNTCLVSLNGGLILPNFSADPKYIFSVGNLTSTARIVMTMTMPGYSNLINMGFMAPGVIQSASSIYDLLQHSSLADLKKMRRHEWMPYVGRLQSFATLGINACTTGYHCGSEVRNAGVKGFNAGFAKPKWDSMGMKTASLFTGSYRENSLFHLNAGASGVGNTTKSSFLHVNMGAEASLLSHAVNTHYLYNSGISVGAESSFTASTIHNDGTLTGEVSFFVNTNQLDNTEGAEILAKHGVVKAKSFKQHGAFKLTDGMLSADSLDNTGHSVLERDRIEIGQLSQQSQLEIKDSSATIQHFSDELSASTSMHNSALNGKTFDSKGHLALDGVSFKYENHFYIDEEAQVQSKNVTIESAEFKDAGHWEYEDALVIRANKATLTDTAVVNGARSDEADLFKEKIKDAEDTESRKETEMNPLEDTAADKMDSETENHETKDSEKVFDPKHVFIINADEVDIDAKVMGGDYTQLHGKKIETDNGDSQQDAPVAKSKHVHIGEHATVDLKYGSIEADDFVNEGATHLDSFSVNIGHLEQKGQMQLERTTGTITSIDDSQNASTRISDSYLKGEAAHFDGQFDASRSAFEYKNAFVFESAANAHTDNIVITTKEFIDKGDLEYENYLEINADRAVIAAGAVLNGQKSSLDELFQEKKPDQTDKESGESDDKAADDSAAETAKSTENTPIEDKKTDVNSTGSSSGTSAQSNPDNQSSEAKEPEKEFKPKHILTINTRKFEWDGQLSGGDYTQIQGLKADTDEAATSSPATEADGTEKQETVAKCNSIRVGEGATADLQYGSIASKELDDGGQINLKNFTLDIDKTEIFGRGHLGLEKTSMKGARIDSDGRFDLKESFVEMTGGVSLSDQATGEWQDATVKAASFTDNSQMNVKGQVAIITDAYKHKGEVKSIPQEEGSDKKNLYYVESKTGSLDGSAHLDHAHYNIKEFDDAEALIRGDGKYSAYQFSDGLGVEVDRDVKLTGRSNRSCGLQLKARSIKANIDYSTRKDLSFISTVSDISLSGNLSGANIYGQSAGAIYTNANINASSLVSMTAEGVFQNLGGKINGDQVAIKAKAILNLTKGSGYSLSMGNQGVINGRTNVFLEATGGNIENHGGMIRAGKYTQLIATGDVKNLCNVGSHWNGYNYVNDYDAALISGGTGENTDNVGLYIKAGGKVISDASDFISDGINYIEGDKGLQFGARQQTYVSAEWTSRKWYGSKKTHTEYTTQVRGSTIHSGSKYNILRTEHGGMNAVATQFSSPGGSLIYARDDVNCYSIKTQSGTVDTKSRLWGLNKSRHIEDHQDATPTLFVDNGLTRIVSTEGTIDARGALFVGGGDLEMEAKHRIKFGCDILDHEISDQSRNVGLSIPGSQAYMTWKSGGSWADVASAEDATLQKLNRMGQCNNNEELLANSANLGIDLYNTTSSVMRGIAGDSLSGELMSRYGLGSAEGFSPTLTASMTESKTTSKYQTLGPGGVARGGNIKLKAGDGVDLDNGVRVHADGDFDIDAPELRLNGAALHSSFDQKTKSESLSFTPTGQIQGASYSQSRTHAEATNHVNAELSAGGNLHLHHGDGAMDSAILNGGNIICKTLDADIKHLEIIDKQDTSTEKTESASASTSGQLSVYKGKSSTKTTNQHSGIHVTDGINNNGHSVHIGDAYMEGGKITTDGVNNIQIDRLVAMTLQDESHSTGLGISLNINDLGRLAGRESTNETGEQAIAVAEMTYDHVNYQATQTAVIHGAQGTDVSIGTLEGSIHTESADGCTETKNEKVHLVIDVPITNRSYLASASKNMKEGCARIGELFERPKAPEPESKAPEKPEIEKKEDQAHDEKKSDADLDIDDTSDEIEAVKDQFPSDDEKWQIIESAPEFQQAEKDVKEIAISYQEHPTPENKAKLDEAIKHCVTVVMKEAANNGWSSLEKLLTHDFGDHLQRIIGSPEAGVNLWTKTYMSNKGILIMFGFNLALNAIDSTVRSDEVFKSAVSQTAAEITFGLVIKRATGGLSGPIGWGLVGLDVMDALFYDENRVHQLIDQGLDNQRTSQQLYREGHYLSAFGLQQVAADQTRAASSAMAMHTVAQMFNEVNKRIASGFEWACEGLRICNPRAPKPNPQLKPGSNQHSLFSSDRTKENTAPPNMIHNSPLKPLTP